MKGILFLIFGIVVLIYAHFTRNNRNIGKFTYIDGEIIDMNSDENKIVVKYLVGDDECINDFSDKDFPYKKVKIGTQVMVMAMKENPKISVSAIYNGYGKDYNANATRKASIIAGVALIILGLSNLFSQ